MCLRFRSNSYRSVGGIKGTRSRWELMLKNVTKWMVNPIPKAPSRNGYEGPFNIPVEEQLYHALTDEAAKAEISLYTLVVQKLTVNGTCCSKTTALTKMKTFIAKVLLIRFEDSRQLLHALYPLHSRNHIASQ